MTAVVEYLKKDSYDYTIAVDGGLEKYEAIAEALGEEKVHLTHIVGDFDTVSSEVLEDYRNKHHAEIRQYQPEKDFTDTDLALKLAIEICQTRPKGFSLDQIVMIGCTGTRMDHTLANIQMLTMAMDAGIEAVIVDGHNRIRMIKRHFFLTESFGKYVSIIPVTPVLKGVTLKGLKYTLDNTDVFLGKSLCVSNEMAGQGAAITIKEGVALLIESKD